MKFHKMLGTGMLALSLVAGGAFAATKRGWLDRAVQIRGAEHYNRIVHPWSCTAAPVHDPVTGALLGVIDITGGAEF